MPALLPSDEEGTMFLDTLCTMITALATLLGPDISLGIDPNG
jgi:hypothetical protein